MALNCRLRLPLAAPGRSRLAGGGSGGWVGGSVGGWAGGAGERVGGGAAFWPNQVSMETLLGHRFWCGRLLLGFLELAEGRVEQGTDSSLCLS